MIRALVLMALFLISGPARADGPECMADISKAFAEAMKAGDVDQILALYLDSAEVLAIESSGNVRRGSKGLRTMYEAAFAETTWTRADFELIRTDVRDQEGFCYFRFTAEGTYKKEGEGGFVLSTQGTWIVRKTKQGWRIVHEHFSPLDGIPRFQQKTD